LFQHLFTIATGALLGVIASRFWKNRPLQLLIGGAYVVLSLLFEGRYIVLEPFTVFFIVASVWLASSPNRMRGFLAGVSLGLAVLCKQYAAFAALPVALVILLDKKLWMQRAVSVAAGGTVTIAAVLVFLVSSGATPTGLRQGIAPIQYLDLAYVRYDIFPHIYTRLPFLLLVPPLLLMRSFRESSLTWVSLAGVLGGSMFLMVRQWEHYYIMFLPFALLLAGQVVENLLRRKTGLGYLGLLTFAPTFILGVSLGKDLAESDARTKQREECAKFAAVTDLKKPTMVLSNPAMMWTCELLPPRNGHGFNFAESYPKAELLDLIPKQDLVIADVESNGELASFLHRRFESRKGEIFESLQSAGFTRVDIPPWHALWIRKSD
jgi:hypothetical protein